MGRKHSCCLRTDISSLSAQASPPSHFYLLVLLWAKSSPPTWPRLELGIITATGDRRVLNVVRPRSKIECEWRQGQRVARKIALEAGSSHIISVYMEECRRNPQSGSSGHKILTDSPRTLKWQYLAAQSSKVWEDAGTSGSSLIPSEPRALLCPEMDQYWASKNQLFPLFCRKSDLKRGTPAES